MKIKNWDIPDVLFNDYVKFRTLADSYLDGKSETPSNTDYERRARWLLCVGKVMETHRKICKALNIEYSEDTDDEFYKEFHRAVDKQVELKG